VHHTHLTCLKRIIMNCNGACMPMSSGMTLCTHIMHNGGTNPRLSSVNNCLALITLAESQFQIGYHRKGGRGAPA
jgi:hypothetical protein